MDTKVAERFRELGIRVTAQRVAVAEVLANSDDHPTAQMVYERVRERFPQITLGTVYNTLAMLEEKGFVQALTFAGGTRYDTNVKPHANLVCIECGRMVDVDDTEGLVDRLRQNVMAEFGYSLLSQRVDFYGTCPDCRGGRSEPATAAS